MDRLVHSNAAPNGARKRVAAKETSRTNDPERTKADIMEVAASEFGENFVTVLTTHWWS